MTALLPLLLALAPSTSGNLEAALETVSPDEIKADLFFFASDEMRGRDTPSLELKVAARFVRARLERLGFQPGAGGGFFHEYPLHSRRIDVERSFLSFEGPGGTARLVFGRDYLLGSSRDVAELTVQGEVVFAGEGEKEDFEAAKVSGRWTLCAESDLSDRRRVRNAESAGALGLIVVPDPKKSDDPFPAQKKNPTQLALEGIVSFEPSPSRKDDEPVFPQVFLTRDALGRLEAVRGSSLASLSAGQTLAVQAREERRGGGPLLVENVCGLWPGSDPVLANELIVVSAHYDHVGVDEDGDIYRGADDNGSGSMGLLAVAEALTEYGPMRRSVMLLWLSGEEKGLWGSAAWTRAPPLPAGMKPVCNLNIDMIGRNAPDKLLITPSREKKEFNGLTRLAESLAPLEGFPKLGSCDEYWERSDHVNFSKNLQIPVAFLFSDVHADYHRPTDTPDKIDYDKIARVSRLVVRLLDGLQSDELAL